MCIYLSSTFALCPQSSHKCIPEKLPFVQKKDNISGFWPATKIKSVRAGKGSWISIHRSFWKTLMCKLPLPQSKHSWWCVHPSCFLLKSPTSLFVIQCIATIFILKLGTILVATFVSDHTQDFLFKKILLTWAACITSHCIWWHLQSKTLTFRQLENSPLEFELSQLYQRHLLWFQIHFFELSFWQ